MKFRSFAILALLFTFAAKAETKTYGLYTWTDGDGSWNYSLVRTTEKHPDKSEIKATSTQSLERIKTRISLLGGGSSIEINPLPVLNLELQLPPSDTIKEFERVCGNSKVHLIR